MPRAGHTSTVMHTKPGKASGSYMTVSAIKVVGGSFHLSAWFALSGLLVTAPLAKVVHRVLALRSCCAPLN